jgi:hypothetical protein
MKAIDRLNYYNDPRVQASFRTSRVKVVSENAMTAVVEVDLGDVTERHDVLVKYGVCPTCSGRGSVVDPALDASGLSYEDLGDRQFRSDYFEGKLNVQCGECGGKRVVLDMLDMLAQMPTETAIALTELEDADEAFLHVQMAELSFGC